MFPPLAKPFDPLVKANNTHNSSIRSDEGLTLETSAFQIFHGSNSTFINSFGKPFFVSLSHRRSTTVSLENRNL